MMKFQWHLTNKCNFRCKHCYQDDYVDDGVDFSMQKFFLEKMKKFAQHFNKKNNVHAHINFTGGEPFLKKDFLHLLNETNEKRIFTYGILSNGYLLSEKKLLLLKKLKPKFIQISLEGGKEMNDYIRGKGSFEKITKALKTYSKLKINVIISFTANSNNYKEFPEVVRIARKYKVLNVWTDRYLPQNKSDNLTMNNKQTKEFFEIILKEQKKIKFYFFSHTKVVSNRALQFLVCGGMPYRCSAGDTLMAFMPNGDIFPCRRLPIKVGNLKKDNLIEVYKNNIFLKKLRNYKKFAENCDNCHYKITCNGGLRCLAYAKYKNIDKKDPNCWIFEKY